MHDFNRVYRIGTAKTYNERSYPIFVKVEYKNKKLSLTGVEGPTSDGNCCGSCGQIVMDMNPDEIKPVNGWSKESIIRLMEIWNKWHLNDMQAGCEHQRKNWNTLEEIEIINFTWSSKFNTMRIVAEDGLMSESEYKEYRNIVPDVFKTTVETTHEKWLSPLACGPMYLGLIKVKSKEMKTAGWVHPYEHPRGLLCKPCEICGYQYGTKWLHEDVPEDVLQELINFPTTDITPAWV